MSYSLSKENFRLEVDSRGAAVTGFWKDDLQIIGSPDNYSGVVLFPWPNRINDGLWYFRGQSFQLGINDAKLNSALHGLVTDREFRLLEKTDTEITFSLQLEETIGYPFEPKLFVSYKLNQTGFEFSVSVSNPTDLDIPFAIGFHPYFLADESSTFTSDDYSFEFQNAEIDETVFSGGKPVTLNTSKYLAIINSDELAYTHIFTNRYDEPGKVWFAMEPQSAPANSLNDFAHTVVLQPGEVRSFSAQISVN